MSNRSKLSLATWLGFRSDVVREDTRWLGRMLGAGIFFSGLIAIGLFVVLLGNVIMAALSADDGADVRNLGLVLAALIGAPFVIWRSAVAAKQAAIQDESLFNDKINAAAEDLAKRRQVTVEDKNVWEDDVVTRVAAIDRLEGLAIERKDAAPRIARLLSIYVRELSDQEGLRAKDHPRQAWLDNLEKPENEQLDEDAFLKARGVTGEEFTQESFKAWAYGLKRCRSDLEKAVQSLGRLIEKADLNPETDPIDLRDANLQGFDLREARLDKALLQNARLEGAHLRGARLEGANLRGARLEGANLWRARLEGANLWAARLEGANLGEARLEGAYLGGARLKGASLREARFDSETDLTAAGTQWAAVRSADLSMTNISQDQANAVFGDRSDVRLPDGIEAPEHWVDGLESLEFVIAWRAWRKAGGYDRD